MDSSILTLLLWPLELGLWILECTLCFCCPSNPNRDGTEKLVEVFTTYPPCFFYTNPK